MSAVMSLWTDVECNGGSAVRGIPLPARASMELALDRKHELRIEAPRNAAWLNAMNVRDVIRVETDYDEVYEWRVAAMTDGMGGPGVVVVLADPPDIELRDAGPTRRVLSGGDTHHNLGGIMLSVAQYIDTYVVDVLQGYGVTWVERGIVDENVKLGLTWDLWTPRQVLQKLADETGLEYDFRRNGATDYRVDMLTEVGSSLGEVLVSDQRNLIQLQRERTREGMYSVVVPVGKKPPKSDEHANIGQATWKVTSVQVDTPTTGQDTIKLEDRDGGDGPLLEDDQHVGRYLFLRDGTTTEILDTTATAGTFVVQTASGTATGDDAMILASATGTLLTELRSPSATASFGRVVNMAEYPSRGERNWCLNPVFGDWSNTPTGTYARADGNHTATATAINLKGLPAAYSFADGDQLFFNPQEVGARRVDGNQTTASDGTIALNLAGGGVPTSQNDDVITIHKTEYPDGWSAYQTSAGRTTVAYLRDPDEQTTLSGTVDGAQQDHVVDVRGLTASAHIYPGDTLVQNPTGSPFYMDVRTPTKVNATGGATIHFYTSVSIGRAFASGSAVEVRRPSFTARTFSNVLRLEGDPFIQGPDTVVKYINGLDTLWVACGLTYYSAKGTTLSGNGPQLTLRDVASASDLASVQMQDQGLAANTDVNFKLQTSYTLSSDEQVAVRIEGIDSTTDDPKEAIYVRWASLHLGGDPEVPPVWGSHGTQLFQNGNRLLGQVRTWQTTYAATIRELIELWGVNPAETPIQLGGTLRIKSPTLSIDQRVRVVEVTYDLINPEDTQVVLDTRRSELTRAIARAKPRPLYAEVNVNVETTATGGSEVKQVVVTSEEPPTQEGSSRSIADPDDFVGIVAPQTVTEFDIA